VLSALVERLGLSSVIVRKLDTTKLFKAGLGVVRNAKTGVEVEIRDGCFDRVLLDATCSGLGQRPRLTQSASLKKVTEYSSYQKKLLAVGVQALKPGGTLVYSTCTINAL
jgi:16S rRNA C967 or C1407 C5-methylase (RsmB/RsmF family)